MEVTRTVIVSEAPDTTVPVITLLSTSPVNVAFGAAYTDAGAAAMDNKDGDITANIVTTITNNVNAGATFDATVPATYTYHYNVSDAAGNAAVEVTRTVIVTPPAAMWPEEVENVTIIVSEISGQTYVNIDILPLYAAQVNRVLVDGLTANKMPGVNQWRATVPAGTTLASLQGKITVVLFADLIDTATAGIDFSGTTYVRVLLKAGVNASTVTANGAALTFNPATGKWGTAFNTLSAGSSVTIQVTDTVGNTDSHVIVVTTM